MRRSKQLAWKAGLNQGVGHFLPAWVIVVPSGRRAMNPILAGQASKRTPVLPRLAGRAGNIAFMLLEQPFYIFPLEALNSMHLRTTKIPAGIFIRFAQATVARGIKVNYRGSNLGPGRTQHCTLHHVVKFANIPW